MGYIDKKGMTATDIVGNRKNADLITIDKNDTIAQAVRIINENNFSQIPVTSDDRIVGSIYENLVFNHILKNPSAKDDKVETIMQEALPFADITTPLSDLSEMISGDRIAVLVKDFKAGRTFIITKSDIAETLIK